MSESPGFHLLHKSVQRWIWQQGWESLRDIQEQAIEPILKADRDIIISACTAAGKTEAAFLPACSKVALESTAGIGVLYLSPLKALINDQHRRLEGLCEMLNMPLTPWHGDVSLSKKQRLIKKPDGILLITPESLESLLLNKSSWCKEAFQGLGHVIIDEFHAFIGTERGCQLLSLLRRLEFLLEKTVPRIALSATLGDMGLVAKCLRPNGKFPCDIIDSKISRSDLKIQQRGYITPKVLGDSSQVGLDSIVDDLFSILRGKSHLVFANSRSRTEEVAAKLADKCEQHIVPNEFLPHHGSLSKEIRESLESRLQEEKLPTTAICTMTLELGIDIGSVDSIAQISPPHSVSSIRQRLGRSGRRDEAAILRLFINENEIDKNSHLLIRLRLQSIQSIAMINLLLNKWYEPPELIQYHFSTLVQQTLSVIGQYGGVRANQLWELLCNTGPFKPVDQVLFGKFLRALGEEDLITQTQDGQLVLGYQGEKIIGHYSFYAAFQTPEEYRLEFNGRVLGTLPIDKPLTIGQLMIFAGKKWEILNIDPDKKLISLKKAKGGKPPSFDGSGLQTHDIIRQEMYRVLKQNEVPVYLDSNAKQLFEEGVSNFHNLELEHKKLIQFGNTTHLLTWLGDKVSNTICILLKRHGLSADSYVGIIEVNNSSVEMLLTTINKILNTSKPSAEELARDIPDTNIEKYDYLLPKDIRDIGYGQKYFDVEGAWLFMNILICE